MTVAELIAILHTLDPSMKVHTIATCECCTDVVPLTESHVRPGPDIHAMGMPKNWQVNADGVSALVVLDGDDLLICGDVHG